MKKSDSQLAEIQLELPDNSYEYQLWLQKQQQTKKEEETVVIIDIY